jgi:hypothetical protein
MKSMKKLLLMAAIAVMVVSLAAPAAMAEEVQDPQSESGGTEPVVGDQPEGSSSSGIVEEESKEEEPARGIPADEEPICMIPEGCETDEKPYQDPGIRQCDLVPPYCQDTDEDSGDDKKNEHNDEDGYPEHCKLPKLVYDPACDKENHHSQDSEDSQDDQGHNSGAHPDADDPNPVEEEEPKKEEASAPGAVKAGEVPEGVIMTAPENVASAPKAVSAPDAAGQTANSAPDIYGCAYDDYYYDEELDMCWPIGPALGVLFGDDPWPESAGGYVGLAGDFVEDPLTGVGLILQAGLGHYVGDTLVEFGEGGGPIGWGIQGLGYAIGFGGDVGGALVVGVGEAVGAVADGVGEVVDAVGDAAEDAWDEVTSWF